MGTIKLFGREPAQWIGLLSAALILFSATVFPLTIEQQGAVTATVTAVFGFIGAAAVAGEKAAVVLAGLIQSVIALGLAFGIELSPEIQGGIMTFVNAGVAWYLRTQVVAPVPPDPVDRVASNGLRA